MRKKDNRNYVMVQQLHKRKLPSEIGEQKKATMRLIICIWLQFTVRNRKHFFLENDHRTTAPPRYHTTTPSATLSTLCRPFYRTKILKYMIASVTTSYSTRYIRLTVQVNCATPSVSIIEIEIFLECTKMPTHTHTMHTSFWWSTANFCVRVIMYAFIWAEHWLMIIVYHFTHY